ncbi:bestrophin family protein [Leptothoe sp. PORK10 BA2]|uniref:bestrophin family protein n=1 Tax=Leptothoe sp. PORK10 BA2 TaxID=3110254 RepID=UPI002B1EA486|nr:bestrophin family ion channel [Leptothoe sp. PORK10 BA2]MEA5462422.1 bestrophin family ion channel [Leptothoe sp. PORK10 BA2]
MAQDRRPWFKTLFCIRGSVIRAVMPRVGMCTGFALGITLLHQAGFAVSWPVLSSVVPSLVLGLLLVFRTNTSYERFWEGRKLWGTMINTVRNLARQIWVSVDTSRQSKEQALKLLLGFAIATKQHLRYQPCAPELTHLLPPAQIDQLSGMNNPPLEIAFWLNDYLQIQQLKGRINPYQFQAMTQQVNILVDTLGGCERILKTPLPLSYSIHLKQLLVMYCMALPFQIVSELNGWTIPVVALVAFAVFGVEEIGLEIENPFGCDLNDLPLNEICQTMERNIQDLITLTPSIETNEQQAWQITALR